MQNCQSCMLPDGVYPVGSFYTILIPQSPSINIKLSRLTFFNMKPPGVYVPEHGGQRPRACLAVAFAYLRWPACCLLQPFSCLLDKEFCFLDRASLALPTSAFSLSSRQRILLFGPLPAAAVRPTSYEPFSCPSLSFFEMILHCRALRATLSSILIDHKNIFGQSRNSALSAVGRDVAGGRKP